MTSDLLMAMRERKARKDALAERNARLFRIFVYLGLACAATLTISITALIRQTPDVPKPEVASTVR